MEATCFNCYREAHREKDYFRYRLSLMWLAIELESVQGILSAFAEASGLRFN
jgi:hypothetical protein